MGDKQTFEATVIKHGTDDVVRIDIPFDVESVFGSKRVTTRAIIAKAPDMISSTKK